jgi:transposase
MRRIDVRLKKEDAEFLKGFVKSGEHKAREITRANVLLLCNETVEIETISKMLSVHRKTICDIKNRYVKSGLESLKDKPRPGQPPKYAIKHETEIAALACAKPPDGRKRWTLVLLEQELRKRGGDYKTMNHESIRIILKKQGKAVDKTNVVHCRNRRKIQAVHV